MGCQDRAEKPRRACPRTVGAGGGQNGLLARHSVEDVESADDAISEDLDTPEGYQRLRSRYGV
jgi:CTP:molybdopterin cytidylyltransferase MocA